MRLPKERPARTLPVSARRTRDATRARATTPRRVLGKRVREKTVGTRANAAMATVTTTASHGLVAGAQATTPPADDGACAMELDEPKRDRLAEEIILAAYRKDAATVASCLKRCSASATAEMSLSRAAAVELLGESVYLGSHSWSTQEGFPVMYFAGAFSSRPLEPAARRASPGGGAGRRNHPNPPMFVFPAKAIASASVASFANRWISPRSRPPRRRRGGKKRRDRSTRPGRASRRRPSRASSSFRARPRPRGVARARVEPTFFSRPPRKNSLRRNPAGKTRRPFRGDIFDIFHAAEGARQKRVRWSSSIFRGELCRQFFLSRENETP